MVDVKIFQKKNRLLLGTLGGVVIGASAGIIIKICTGTSSAIVREAVEFPGELYMRALKMLVLPSIIFSVIIGSASLNIKENSRIFFRTFFCFFLTSTFNSILGLVLVTIIHPGNQAVKENITEWPTKMFYKKQNTLLDNMMDFARNLIPGNMFTTLSRTTLTTYTNWTLSSEKVLFEWNQPNLLGVIMLSLVIGSVLSTLKEQAMVVLQITKTCELVIMKISEMVMWATPVGVGCLICSKLMGPGNFGSLLVQLGLFIGTVLLGLLLYHFIIIQLVYYWITKKNPVMFYLDILPAIMTGFALQSSSSSLPVTLQCLDKNAKIDSRISHFVVPLGATINMDGTALFVTIASVFIAQLNGDDLELGFLDYLGICLIGTAVSIATSGTPSASLTIMFILLHFIGSENAEKDISLLFAVDWFLDRLRTANNVLGNCYTAAIIEHLSKNQLESMDVTF